MPGAKGRCQPACPNDFESTEALNQGLASDARRVGALILRIFPDFEGRIFHQALQGRKYFEIRFFFSF